MLNYDAIIIGTGQSGPALARRLVAAGRKVAIIERKQFGGTCVNTGCTPTKTLIASAYVAHVARRAADYGVRIEGAVNVDMKAVKARKDAVVAVFRNGVEQSLKTLQGCTVYEGHGRFVAEKKVAVNDSELAADQIFINVGARAAVPPIPGLDQVPYLTNSSMMDIDFLPSHLMIMGGSYVGLEFAQAYRRFGSKVTVIEFGPRLISREDDDVSQAVAGFLKEEGIDVRVNSKIVGVEKQGNSIAAKVESAGSISQIAGTHLLVATGRRPNTDDLGLDKAGIGTDARGYIQVDDQLRTNISGIWAMGDCNGRGAFTHTSWNDFEIVAANLLDNDQRRVSDRITAYALYTDPPLGRAGMTEAEVRKTGKSALISTMAMKDVMRAYEKGETKGFMKILVDRDNKQILGASFLGLEGDEVIHCVLDIMYAKAPYTVIQRAMHIHPTVSEFIPTMMDRLKPLQCSGSAEPKQEEVREDPMKSERDGINPAVEPSGTGCVECLALGGWWFHLRRCAECGHIGCCDSSPNQHASKHNAATGHPIITSFEPGERWFYDYRTEQFLTGPKLHAPHSHPLDQPVPGPAGAVPSNWQTLLHE